MSSYVLQFFIESPDLPFERGGLSVLRHLSFWVTPTFLLNLNMNEYWFSKIIHASHGQRQGSSSSSRIGNNEYNNLARMSESIQIINPITDKWRHCVVILH